LSALDLFVRGYAREGCGQPLLETD
jgi:hypothetical protein